MTGKALCWATSTSIVVILLAFASIRSAEAQSRAQAQAKEFNVAAQSATTGIPEFARQAGIQILVSETLVHDKRTAAVTGSHSVEEALGVLLKGTGLIATTRDGVTYTVAVQPAPTTSLNRTAMAASQTSSQSVAADQAPPAPSPETNKLKSALEEIVVTGTHIRGETQTLSSVVVISKADIERSGVYSTSELMEKLPENFGGGASQYNSMNNSPGAIFNVTGGTGIDLFGLGMGATLVLVNGMRIAPSGRGTFVDISAIPLSAIERVEILTDGASAIYGSDAVAGVVNFILRDTYDGAQTRARYGSVTDGSMNDERFSQTLGKVWNSGNLLGTYEYQDSNHLNAVDRPYSLEGLPQDLLPSSIRQSLFLSGKQELTEAARLTSSLLATERHDSNVFTQANQTYYSRDAATTISSSIGVDAEVGRDWNLHADSTYGLNREKSATVNLPGPPPISLYDTKTTLFTIDTQANGPVVPVPGGVVRAAVGADFRRDGYWVNPESFGGPGTPAVDLGRTVKAVYAELRIPIVGDANRFAGAKRIDFSAAVRSEDYSDAGRAMDPKFSALWTPVSGFNVRGGWGRSFNAPRLDLQGPYNKFAYTFTPDEFGGPYPAPFNSNNLVLVNQGVSPTLHAERSTNWTAGLEWAPTGSPNKVSATYFNYRYVDRIAPPAENAEPFLQYPGAYSQFITVNPTQAQVESIVNSAFHFANFATIPFNPATTPVGAIIDDSTTNLAVTRISGIELSATYKLVEESGDWQFGINSNSFLRYDNAASANAPYVSVLNYVYNPVKLKARGSISWAKDGYDASLFTNYVTSYRDDDQTPTAHVASWTTFDAHFAADLGRATSFDAMKGFKLSLAVQNLFDRAPPYLTPNNLNSLGFDATNANPLGRFIAVEIVKEWR